MAAAQPDIGNKEPPVVKEKTRDKYNTTCHFTARKLSSVICHQ